MRQLLATTDEVLIASVSALLAGEGIEVFVLDRHVSVMEGSLGIFPRRVMVTDEDHGAAARLLEAAGFGPYRDDG